MHFDGAKSKNGASARVVLISPSGEIKKYSFYLTWSCTNNATEYEAICLGLKQPNKLKIKCLTIFGDSELIINQVIDKCSTKHHYLKKYRNRLWDLLESFNALNFVAVLKDQNSEVDALA